MASVDTVRMVQSEDTLDKRPICIQGGPVRSAYFYNDIYSRMSNIILKPLYDNSGPDIDYIVCAGHQDNIGVLNARIGGHRVGGVAVALIQTLRLEILGQGRICVKLQCQISTRCLCLFRDQHLS